VSVWILASKLALVAGTLSVAAWQFAQAEVVSTPLNELVIGGSFLAALITCFSLLLRHVLAQDTRMDGRAESILDRALEERDEYKRELTECRAENRHLRDELFTMGWRP